METKQSFSLRKLSVGLASVLIGISFLNGTKVNVVKADIKESPKENVQDAQNKNNEDMQAVILKNTSSQNADMQNTTQTDHTNVNTNADSSTSAVQDTSADQVGQVAGAERGDSSARETRTSQLGQVNSDKSTRTSQLGQVNSIQIMLIRHY